MLSYFNNPVYDIVIVNEVKDLDSSRSLSRRGSEGQIKETH